MGNLSVGEGLNINGLNSEAIESPVVPTVPVSAGKASETGLYPRPVCNNRHDSGQTVPIVENWSPAHRIRPARG